MSMLTFKIQHSLSYLESLAMLSMHKDLWIRVMKKHRAKINRFQTAEIKLMDEGQELNIFENYLPCAESSACCQPALNKAFSQKPSIYYRIVVLTGEASGRMTKAG
jgi:hypothetical protein